MVLYLVVTRSCDKDSLTIFSDRRRFSLSSAEYFNKVGCSRQIFGRTQERRSHEIKLFARVTITWPKTVTAHVKSLAHRVIPICIISKPFISVYYFAFCWVIEILKLKEIHTCVNLRRGWGYLEHRANIYHIVVSASRLFVWNGTCRANKPKKDEEPLSKALLWCFFLNFHFPATGFQTSL